MKNKKVKTGKHDYLDRIDQFYRRSLPSNREIVVLRYTPKYLIQLGAKQLPIVIKQSVLSKCIRPPKGSIFCMEMKSMRSKAYMEKNIYWNI